MLPQCIYEFCSCFGYVYVVKKKVCLVLASDCENGEGGGRAISVWCVTIVFPYGYLELEKPNGELFKVNGNRVKHYLSVEEGDVMVCEIEEQKKSETLEDGKIYSLIDLVNLRFKASSVPGNKL